ncbi:MAG: flagellin [Bdellovibrionales bacterium GWB1_55_8]|nr:MAG: flagellin [Bdellovibrionales bacterium GWB1_55_8]
MGLRIATNMASIAANRALQRTSSEQSKTYTRLSSGQRITQAGDDAAGLSISENLRAQIRSTTQAERNANDGISFAQVAEGGLSEIGNIMIRLRELAIQAGSDTVGDKERSYINTEVQSLVQEVDRIANVTSFNGTPLLNGQNSKAELEFQVGTRNDEADRILFNTSENDVRASSLGVEGLDYETIDGARESIDRVDEAINRVSGSRARLGAMQNKLHASVNNLGITKENLSQARSRIADADVAAETSELVRGNILQQAGISVLAQANSAPMAALKLL